MWCDHIFHSPKHIKLIKAFTVKSFSKKITASLVWYVAPVTHVSRCRVKDLFKRKLIIKWWKKENDLRSMTSYNDADTHSIHNKEENYSIFCCLSIKFTLEIHIVLKSWFGSRLQTKYASLFKILLGRSFTEQNCLFVKLKTPSQPKMLKRYCMVFLCNIKSILRMDGVTGKKNIFSYLLPSYIKPTGISCALYVLKRPSLTNWIFLSLLTHSFTELYVLAMTFPESQRAKKEKTPCMHWLHVRWCALQGDYQTFKHHATASSL